MQWISQWFKTRQWAGIWLLLAGLLVSSGLHRFWTDSEMWAVSASKFLFTDRAYFLGIKPLFHGFLWLNYQLSSFVSLYPMDLGRWVWGGLALGVMVLCDQLLKAKKLQFRERFLFQMLLFGTSFWMYRSTEVRSDMIGTFLFLVVFYLMTSRPIRTFRHFILSFVLFIASLLFTMKSVFAFFPILLIRRGSISLKKRKIHFLLYSTIFLGLIFHRMVWESLTFFLRQFNSLNSVNYFSSLRFLHLIRLFRENPQVSVLLLLVVGLAFLSVLKKKPIVEKSSFWSALFFMVLLWAYPDPLPFFIAAYIPLFYLFSFIFLKNFLESLNNKIVWVLSVIFIVNALLLSKRSFHHSNSDQRAVVQWALNEFENKSNILLYDPSGFYTPMNGEHWFVGPSMSKNYYESVFKTISREEPEVIFYTQKLMFLEPFISQLFSEKYFRWAPSVFLRAQEVKSLKGKNCNQIENRLRKSIFKRRESMDKEISIFIHFSKDQSGYCTVASIQDLCQLIENEENKKIYVFATQLPTRPIDNFVELFRYDPFF